MMMKRLMSILAILALLVSPALVQDHPAAAETAKTQSAPMETAEAAEAADATAEPLPTRAPKDGMPYLLDDNDAAPVKLSDWEGKVTFLNFFTTWCGYCKLEMPDLKQLQQEYGDNLRVVLVHIPDGEDEADARAYLEKEGLTDLDFVEDNGFFRFGLKMQGYPMSLIIDAEGYASGVYRGYMDIDTMREAVRRAGAVEET